MTKQKTTISRAEIVEKTQYLIEPWLGSSDSINAITENTNLTADIGLDSVGILQLVLGIEKEFGITVKDHELDSDMFSRMGNLIDIIEKKINENN